MTPKRRKAPPGPTLEVTLLNQSVLEDKILLGWHTDICKRAEVVDPHDELHWRSLWMGYAIAKGLDPTRADRIYSRKAAPFEVIR
jgi:hypothetical protein